MHWDSLITNRVHASTEEKSRLEAILDSQRQHGDRTGRGVRLLCLGDVGKACLGRGGVVDECSLPVGLHEEETIGEEPSERVCGRVCVSAPYAHRMQGVGEGHTEVGRLGISEEGRSNWWSSRRPELVRGITLT
jgi:hypothetical protein